MFYDIIIIGGGAAGLMAAYGAASSEPHPAVLVLEKMPRPGRKIMITGKGRCNFTNVKEWQDFSAHIRTKQNFLRPSFRNLTPEKLISLLEEHGMESVVERGDRAFPASHRSSDVVDALSRAAAKAGAVIRCSSEVSGISKDGGTCFSVGCSDGSSHSCTCLIIATGGLSYPSTGSSGDGYSWAEQFGHTVRDCFPSLTAMVPKNYKTVETATSVEKTMKGHMHRSLPLSETGKALCGVQLRNVGLTLVSNGSGLRSVTGDVDFTDGGIEGPVGFALSRDCVKGIVNGNRMKLVLDLKPGVGKDEILARIKGLWSEILKDPRSGKASLSGMAKILLGKLMPWDLIPGFLKCNPGILCGKKSGGHIDAEALAAGLKEWEFEIEGFVGYERCVVTAGGVSTDEVLPKTMESRICRGLFLCGEVLDIDSDTGGYNLHTAFATGLLAGRSAAAEAMSEDA